MATVRKISDDEYKQMQRERNGSPLDIAIFAVMAIMLAAMMITFSVKMDGLSAQAEGARQERQLTEALTLATSVGQEVILANGVDADVHPVELVRSTLQSSLEVRGLEGDIEVTELNGVVVARAEWFCAGFVVEDHGFQPANCPSEQAPAVRDRRDELIARELADEVAP